MSLGSEIVRLIGEIRNDRIHGASQLARQAAYVLKSAAERSHADSVELFLTELREIRQRLMSARPAMAPLSNIVNRLFETTASTARTDLVSVRQLTISIADELVNDSLQASARIAGFGTEIIAADDRIMTHSYSSTVLAALKHVFTERGNIEVMVTQSGPGRTGEQAAQELGLHGIPVTFIDDVAMGLYISSVNKVMVGADRVCADGSVVNGIGTYQLALAAKKATIPFYVLCETLKFDPRLRGDEVDLEEKEPSELAAPETLPARVVVKNPYFDVTPLELVTGIVTENGLLVPEEVIGCIKSYCWRNLGESNQNPLR